jgi:nucleotide-binding universal stress UspA family protein
MVSHRLAPVDGSMNAMAALNKAAEASKARAVAAGDTTIRAFVRTVRVARGVVVLLGGRRSIEGFLLGSVSHKVAGMADCPVLVV